MPKQQSIEISVIVCTHNPRSDYLQRVIHALRAQTLSKSRWELLLVDNASSPPLRNDWNLDWHPEACYIWEERVGLTFARLAGISKARSDLLVFVDDDNVLAPAYLETAIGIAKEFPQIGAFGCSLRAEFEVPVPAWATPYLDGLCIKELSRDRWANDYSWSEAIPYGAGMCVRGTVAEKYHSVIKGDSLRRGLDRSGGRLNSAGDLDLAWTAIDLGLGTGRFRELTATHLIPSARLTKEYIVRLYAGFAYSNNIIWAARGLISENAQQGWRDKVRWVFAFLTFRGIRRAIFFADRRATKEAWKIVRDVQNPIEVRPTGYLVDSK